MLVKALKSLGCLPRQSRSEQSYSTYSVTKRVIPSVKQIRLCDLGFLLILLQLTIKPSFQRERFCEKLRFTMGSRIMKVRHGKVSWPLKIVYWLSSRMKLRNILPILLGLCCIINLSCFLLYGQDPKIFAVLFSTLLTRMYDIVNEGSKSQSLKQ